MCASCWTNDIFRALHVGESLESPSGAQGSSLDPSGPRSLPQEAALCNRLVEMGAAKRKFRLRIRSRSLRLQTKESWCESEPGFKKEIPDKRFVCENYSRPAHAAHGWPADVLRVDWPSEVQIMELLDCLGSELASGVARVHPKCLLSALGTGSFFRRTNGRNPSWIWCIVGHLDCKTVPR